MDVISTNEPNDAHNWKVDVFYPSVNYYFYACKDDTNASVLSYSFKVDINNDCIITSISNAVETPMTYYK